MGTDRIIIFICSLFFSDFCLSLSFFIFLFTALSFLLSWAGTAYSTWATGWIAEELWFTSPYRQETVLFSKVSKLGSTQTFAHWLLGSLSPLVKQMGCEADTTRPCSVQRLWMGGAITPVLQTLSWYTQRKLYLYLSFSTSFLHFFILLFSFSVSPFACILLPPSFTQERNNDINMYGETVVMHRWASFSRKKWKNTKLGLKNSINYKLQQLKMKVTH